MPKRKRPTETPEEQFARFKEIAQEHGADQASDAIGKAFKKIAKRQTLKSVAQKRT